MSRHKIDVWVEGVDGSEWHVSGENSGGQGVRLMDEFVGLLDTPASTLWTSGANQIGGSFQAVRFDAREVTLSFLISDSDSSTKNPLQWQSVDSRWRRAWSYQEDSTLVVLSSSGRRELRLRLNKTPEHKLGKGGQFRGVSTILMSLMAGNPLWRSEDETTTWRFDGVNWVGEIPISNPTDMPMHLVWTLTGPASFILPDHSFEDREGWPGYEHQDRRIVLPHQPPGVDVVVDTNPEVEQVVALDRPAWWAKMNGQMFMYSVPPWTEETLLPIAVNPLPWTADVWRTLQIPFEIPAEFLVHVASVLTRILSPLGTETVLSWTADDVAEHIRQALEEAADWAESVGLVGPWLSAVLQALSRTQIAELIANTWGNAWGQVFNMPGAGLQVRQIRHWSRPYGLE